MKCRSAITAIGVTTAALLLVSSPAAGAHSTTQRAPGTVDRPILSSTEASPFTTLAYSGYSGEYTDPQVDPWTPADLADGKRLHPDYLVGTDPTVPGVTHTSVQAAVNAAATSGQTTRVHIAILPGTYTETVYIPSSSPPLALYGTGDEAEDVTIEYSLDATVSPATWVEQVNPSGQYVEGDPAWSMYESCATRTSSTAGLCATVVWSQATDVLFHGLTIVNSLLDTVDSGTHQALALRTDADQTVLDSVRLISRQDTFYANASGSTTIARVWVRDSYIEGDTDFVFGRASAVFERTEFHVVSTRKTANGVIFAPNTLPGYSYGYLVTNCRITADDGYVEAPTAHLGRAWDMGASSTGYIPGTTSNGQLVIRDTFIGQGFDTTSPWAAAATTSRPYAGNIAADRDLNDVDYNRLWEYRNTGPGSRVTTA